MPLYEYLCQNCGHTLEALQKFSDAPLTKCPQCGKDTLSKKISMSGFQLKGSGWYVTDFKNQPKKDAEKKVEKTETKTEKKETPPPKSDTSGETS